MQTSEPNAQEWNFLKHLANEAKYGNAEPVESARATGIEIERAKYLARMYQSYWLAA